MLFSAAPDAVNTSPAVVYPNLYTRFETPSVHFTVPMSRPPATYPPCAVISATIDDQIEIVESDVIVPDAEFRCNDILNVPVCSVRDPFPIFFFAAA
jgi:hypothetical protein